MDPFLVEPDWLAARLHDPDILVIDCSWYVPEAGKSGRAEFEQAHIPGARFFDLDAASDRESAHVNMLPPAQQFAEVVAALGMRDGMQVVIYDSSYVSARVWWMFRMFGHDRVAVLNGGWKRWQHEGRPIESGTGPSGTGPSGTGPSGTGPSGIAAGGDGQATPDRFQAREPAGGVATWQEVLAALDGGGIVDARGRDRFSGEASSGYPGIPGGHMPGAHNVPWNVLIPQTGDFTFLDPDGARQAFVTAGVDLDAPLIATCGSGVTAAIVVFQLARLGKTDVTLYDGAWHEWGQRADLPKVSV